MSKFVLVAALICSLGLHWTLLQSIAWARMVVVYTQTSTLREAVAKTLDGKHPCSLCKAIAEGKKSEKKPESVPVVKKLEFSYCRTPFVFCAPTHFWRLAALDERPDSANGPPPVPPPKSFPG